MAAGSERTSAAIAPGSTEYGQRGELEAGLSAAMGGSAPPGQGPASGLTTGAAGVGGPTDPVGSLLAGELSPTGGPVTGGLNVGPGPGSHLPDPSNFPLQLKLQALAQFAESPFLRAQARTALMRMTKGRSQ